jgi:hypothetical protein
MDIQWVIARRRHLAQQAARDAEFNESDHPRDDDGKFASGGGSSQEKSTPRENAMSYLPEIKKAVEDAVFEYENVGIRVSSGELPRVGDILPHSFKWNPDKGTIEKTRFNGTSALKVKRETVEHVVKQSQRYTFNGKNGDLSTHVVLIGSDKASKGEDPGEILVNRPKVIAVFPINPK